MEVPFTPDPFFLRFRFSSAAHSFSGDGTRENATLLAGDDSQKPSIWRNYAVLGLIHFLKATSPATADFWPSAGEETRPFRPNSPDSRQQACRVQREVSFFAAPSDHAQIILSA
jgi:hypothetical protein